MKFEEPDIQLKAEKEQTPEEIRSVLETAIAESSGNQALDRKEESVVFAA